MVELITVVLKIFFTFMKAYMAWNKEERERFEERMKNLSGVLKEAINDQSESMNEEAYLSNLEWEKKQRYEAYKKSLAPMLARGAGYESLISIKGNMGLSQRIIANEPKVVEILVKSVSVDEKCKLIASLLVE